MLTQRHGWSLHSLDRLQVRWSPIGRSTLTLVPEQKAVRSEARRHLDMTVSYRRQNKDAVQRICETVSGIQLEFEMHTDSHLLFR